MNAINFNFSTLKKLINVLNKTNNKQYIREQYRLDQIDNTLKSYANNLTLDE